MSLLHPDAAKNLGVDDGEVVTVSLDGASGEAKELVALRVTS